MQDRASDRHTLLRRAACFLPLMLLGVAIGCGGSDPSPSTPAPVASPSPPPPPPPSPAPAPAPAAATESGDTSEEATPPAEDEASDTSLPQENNTQENTTEQSDTEAANMEDADAENGPTADVATPNEETPGDNASETDESSQPTEETDTAAEKPTRPEAIAEWKTDDYLTAMADEDPKLVEAVEHLGRQFVDNPSAAGLLVRLVKPPQPPEPTENEAADTNAQPAYSPPSQSDGAKLNAAIIGALGINNTNESRKALAQLLIGKIPTEDEAATVGLVLKALSENACPENEAILLRVLTEAEKLRPQTDGPVTAESLRQQAFDAVKEIASARLRVELAKHLLKPTTPGPQKTMLLPWLEETRPENLGAQMLLYGQDATPKETKAALEKQFTQAASTAMALALRISTGANGTPPVVAVGGYPATDTEAPDPDAPYRAIGPIWSPAGVAMIEARLSKLESLETQASLVMLGCVVPVKSTRSALWQTIDAHWDDGPADLISGGLLSQITSDPGVLMSLKSAADKQPSRRVVGREALEKFQETRQSWEKLADDAVKNWCRRLHEAALAEAATAQVGVQPAAGETTTVDLPIELHKDAKVACYHRVDWPADVQAKLPGVAVGPMEMRYVRIEEKARLVATKGFYRRRLNPAEKDLRETDDSVWMASCRTVPGTDRRRSIDLVITRADGPPKKDENDREADEAENLIIEILTLEMKDHAPE